MPYTGIMGINATFDHVGPIARRVADLARVMDVIAGADPSDPRQQRPIPCTTLTAPASRRPTPWPASGSASSKRASRRRVKPQLSLERHGAHTMPGLIARTSQRLLALAAAIWFNWQTGQPGHSLTAYDH